MSNTEILIESLIKMRQDPNGDSQEQFWKLIERFRADLVNQAFVILHNQEDAEDVAQETLSQAFINLDQLRDATKLSAWLRGINRHLAQNLQRRQCRAKEERLATAQANALEAPKGTTLGTDKIRAVDGVIRAVDSLPDQFRDVLTLYYWERLSNSQIAERLSIPLGTVRSRLARADRMLAQKLKCILQQEEHPK